MNNCRIKVLVPCLAIFLLVCFFIVLMTGCDFSQPQTSSEENSGTNISADESGTEVSEDPNEQLRNMFYCDAFDLAQFPLKISLTTGEIVVPCPDPLCKHGKDDLTCPLRNTMAYYQVDGGRYMFYVAYTGSSTYHLFCFDSMTNQTESIFDFLNIDDLDLIFGDGKLFFRNPLLEKKDGQWVEKPVREVMCYDTETKKMTAYGRCSILDRLRWYSNGELGFVNADGALCIARNGFSETKKLVDDIARGYAENDLILNFQPNYLYSRKEQRYLRLPQLTSPETIVSAIESERKIYCTIGNGGIFGAGEFYRNHSEDGYFRNILFVIDRDGTAKKYEILCDYCIYSVKAYKNFIMFGIWKLYQDGNEIDPNDQTGNYIRIDLNTGKADIYNLLTLNLEEIHVRETSVHVTCSDAIMSDEIYDPSHSDDWSSNESSEPEESGSGTDYFTYPAFPDDQLLEDETKKDGYYCPSLQNPYDIPLRMNVRTGEVQYACPVPGCDHTSDDCFYNNVIVGCTYDTGNCLIVRFSHLGYANNNTVAFRYSDGKIFGVYSGRGEIIGCEGRTLYTAYTQYGTTSVYACPIDDDRPRFLCKLKSAVFFFEKQGVLYGQDEEGFFKLSADGVRSAITIPDAIGDGEYYKFRKDGFAYRTKAPAAVFDYQAETLAKLPAKKDVTSPVKDGNEYYYQVRRAATTARNQDGKTIQYIPYENDVYCYDLSGRETKTTVVTDYHFIVYAVSGDYAVGRLMYRMNGKTYVPYEELEYDHIRINLSDGSFELLKLYR